MRLIRPFVATVGSAMWLSIAMAPVHAATPNNDLREHAAVVQSLPYSDITSSAEATISPDDPGCRGQGGTIWWSLTPTEDGRLEANTFGSQIDTVLGVFAADPDGLTLVGCNDDENEDDFTSQVLFDASAGVTYYFMVSRFNPGGGVVEFNLRSAPRLTTLAVDVGSGAVARGGTGLIRGTATCDSPGAYTLITVTVTQGRRTVAEGFANSTCGPTGIQWSVTVQSADRRLHPGWATVAYSAEAANGYDPWVTTSGSESIRLAPPRR